jgi:hypothetical protein
MMSFTFCQSLTDKYLHFRTDYYWDTILYKSEQDFYYEINSGRIVQKEYPVLQYLYSKMISDTPRVAEVTFERRDLSDPPYKYIRKGNSIYLQYFDLREQKIKLNREYTLSRSDTVNWLANKNSLDSKDGISVSGFSIYLGQQVIAINGQLFKSFRFLEDHYELGSHSSYYTKEVFLDQLTLIPIKFVMTQYDYKTRKKLLYSSVTFLTSSGKALSDYTNKQTADLVLYENKSKVWTGQQKQEFFKMFAPNMKQYVDCLLNKLDGHISFYHFEQSPFFKSLVVRKECER